MTDDTMADVLYEQGPLNAVVQKGDRDGISNGTGNLLCHLYTVSANAFL